jgi:hypothetical protein
MAADATLTELAAVLGDLAEAQAIAGHHNVEAALYQSRLLLVEACIDDGVELDGAQLGFTFGVVDDDAL